MDDPNRSEVGTRPYRWLVRLFVPRVDELTVFLIGLASLLILATDPGMRAEAARLLLHVHHSRRGSGVGGLGAALIVVFGFGVATYNVFVIHSAEKWEKASMLAAAVLLSASASIAAGLHLWNRGSWVTMVLPAWNVVNGLMLLFLFKSRLADEGTFDDRDATRLSLAVGTAVCLGGWAICRWVVHLHWALTLCTVVFYATNVQALVTRFVESHRASRARRA